MAAKYDITRLSPASETTQIGKALGIDLQTTFVAIVNQGLLSGLGGPGDRDMNEFRKRSRIGFLHNRRPVGFDCSLTNAERVGDYLIGFSLKYQLHDLVLTKCQCGDTFRRCFVP